MSELDRIFRRGQLSESRPASVPSTGDRGRGASELLIGLPERAPVQGANQVVHEDKRFRIIKDAEFLRAVETCQVVEGASVVVDLARGNRVVWRVPGTVGTLGFAAVPEIPEEQILGDAVRQRAWGATVYVVWLSAGSKTLNLPGTLGEPPEGYELPDWSTGAGKVDVVACEYVEPLGRWFSYIAGVGY